MNVAHKLAIGLFSFLFIGLIVVTLPYADICAHTTGEPDKHQQDACSGTGGSATNTPAPTSVPTATPKIESGASTDNVLPTATPTPGINIQLVIQTEAQPTVAPTASAPESAPATGRGE
jgi:hypothetical protein